MLLCLCDVGMQLTPLAKTSFCEYFSQYQCLSDLQVEAGSHIWNILCHLARCQTMESREEAVLDTVKDVMPPQGESLVPHRWLYSR